MTINRNEMAEFKERSVSCSGHLKSVFRKVLGRLSIFMRVPPLSMDPLILIVLSFYSIIGEFRLPS